MTTIREATSQDEGAAFWHAIDTLKRVEHCDTRDEIAGAEALQAIAELAGAMFAMVGAGMKERKLGGVM